MKTRPIETVDVGGRLLVKVPLGKHNKYQPQRYAEIWKDDHEFLGRLGLNLNWACYRVKSGGHYVTAAAGKMKGNRVLVARVLLDAGPGQIVRYIDGNPLNLRRENLRLVSNTRAKVRARNFVYSKTIAEAR